MELYEEVFLAQSLTAPQEPWECDAPDAIFLSARAVGDWEDGDFNEGIICRAARIYKEWQFPDHAFRIVLNGHANLDENGLLIPTSYSGPEPWEHLLVGWGVPLSHILRSRGGQHTGTETIAFIECAKDHGWNCAMILANPHQLLRTMMAVVKAIHVVDYHLKVIPVAPVSYSWKTMGYGSQGGAYKSWVEQCRDEIQKLPGYIDRGFICTFQELEQYVLSIQE